MTFQPVLPLRGLPGWVLLNKTLDRQTELFNQSPQIVRDTDYFEQKIGEVRTAAELVSDRRLLRVALGAFGLGDDLNSRALVQRVLEDGTEGQDALANRLADERYNQLSNAFGFGGPGLPSTQFPGFGTEIAEKFRRREFEVAVGEQDDGLRLALNTERELDEILSEDSTEDTKWFTIMGTPPLRKVFEVALGLPSSFGQLDIDRQLETFKDQFAAKAGVDNVDDLAEAENKENFIRLYLLREQIASVEVQSSSSIALTLLQSSRGIFA